MSLVTARLLQHRTALNHQDQPGFPHSSLHDVSRFQPSFPRDLVFRSLRASSSRDSRLLVRGKMLRTPGVSAGAKRGEWGRAIERSSFFSRETMYASRRSFVSCFCLRKLSCLKQGGDVHRVSRFDFRTFGIPKCPFPSFSSLENFASRRRKIHGRPCERDGEGDGSRRTRGEGSGDRSQLNYTSRACDRSCDRKSPPRRRDSRGESEAER